MYDVDAKVYYNDFIVWNSIALNFICLLSLQKDMQSSRLRYIKKKSQYFQYYSIYFTKKHKF